MARKLLSEREVTYVASLLMNFVTWRRHCDRLNLTPQEAVKMPGAQQMLDVIELVGILGRNELVDWPMIDQALRSIFKLMALSNPNAKITQAQIDKAIVNLQPVFKEAVKKQEYHEKEHEKRKKTEAANDGGQGRPVLGDSSPDSSPDGALD